tara:strand:+ start:543 stop:1265 length:723 start_codon:yes stop_codon:yes gene_type:complete
MALDLYYSPNADLTTSDSTSIGDTQKLLNKTSVTRNGAQSTASRRPTHRTSGVNANLDDDVSSLSFDGNDGLDLSAQVSLGTSPYTLICAWVGGDYSSDTWLFTSNTNTAHYGIAAGGAGVLLEPNSNRSPGGDEDTIPTNNTDNSTISYTFGSDVEALIISNEDDDNVNFYNIDGALIATKSESLYDSTFPLDFIMHNGAGSRGLNGLLLQVQVRSGKALTAQEAKGVGQAIKNLKDED